MPKKFDREPIAWITRGGKHVPIFDKTYTEAEYDAMSLDELRAIKKRLYSKPDIESAMSEDEKLLNKVIAKKFGEINARIMEKRRKAGKY